MKSKTTFVGFLFLLFVGITNIEAGTKPSIDQNVPEFRTCGTPILPVSFETWLSEKKAQFALGDQDLQYTIPVIFHIIHNGQAIGTGTNISNAQILSQIESMNLDYKRLNADTFKTPSIFKPLASSIGISFCPALIDPDGNVLEESGVDRVNRQDLGLKAAPYAMDYIDSDIKPVTIWDPNEYLNIWVLSIGGSILGYATFPASGSSGLGGLPGGSSLDLQRDGVVISYQALGTTGAAQAPYNKGRTTTHEVGHWLGLRHIWGDNGRCGGTDYCDDTPKQQGENSSPPGANYGCPTYPFHAYQCENNPYGDMFMNYMDYTNDACMNMFTADQVSRMQTVLAFSPLRMNLVQSSKCNAPNQIDAQLTIVRPLENDSTCAESIQAVVKIKGAGNSALTSGTIQYRVDAGTLQNFVWTGSLSYGNTAIVVLPSVNLGGVGTHTFQATLINPNGVSDPTPANNTQSISIKRINPTPTVISPPYSEGFQTATFPPTGWKYTPKNNFKWKRYTATGGFGTSSACMRMDNFTPPSDITGQRDILYLPAINFSGADNTLALRFDVAYARYDETTSDSLIVSFSSDCGLTWNKVYDKGGESLATTADNDYEFIPAADQWRTESISLASYAGLSPVLMRIESVSGWGNYVYVDNINLFQGSAGQVPTASFSLSKDTICVGETLTLSDASLYEPTSWTWTMTGGTPASSGAQNPTVSYATPGIKTITLIASNNTGSSTLVSKQVVVSVKPEVSVNSDTICKGKTAVLTATGATTYSWSTSATTNSITVSPTVNTVYSVTGTKAGCASSVNASVTVNPLPAVPTIAKNGDILTSSYASGNQWYRNGVLIPGAINQNYTVTQAGNYTVVYTNNNDCSSTSAALNVTSVGIFDNVATDFFLDLSPNPNKGIFMMQLSTKTSGVFKLSIRNVLGQIVKEKSLGKVSQQYNEKVDISSYGEGVYFFTLEKENKFITRKILVQ